MWADTEHGGKATMAAGCDGSTEGAAPGRFRILSDAPALDGPDPLDFEEMARGLERIIIASRPSTPFTVSIEAGWGAGKSSLMRRLERRLRPREFPNLATDRQFVSLVVDDVPKRTDHQHLPSDVELIVATSGDEARRILASRRVDLLISDIGREGSPNAGLADLALFRSDDLYDGTAISYTTRPTTRHVEEASKLGADVTADPSQLEGLVRRHLPPESPRGTEKAVRRMAAP